MWPVIVEKHACLIVTIVRVATNVITSFDDKTGLAKLACHPLGKHGTRKACAYDEEIKSHENANRNVPMNLGGKFNLS